MSIKKYLQKHYYYIYLSLSFVLIGYVLFAIIIGEVKICARGPLCTVYNLDDNKGEFIFLSLAYLLLGVLFLYMYFRER